MNILRITMRGKSQEPPIVPPIARGSFDVTLDFADDKDKNTCMQWSEPCDDGKPRATCYLCRYWSGRVANNPADLICAVNIPQPTEEELDAVSGRIAYAIHNCQDFEQKPETDDRQ